MTAASPSTSDVEQALPGVWRWADPAGSDRCGTAIATPDGLALVDPPALSAAAREQLAAGAGPIRHVVLTSARHAALAAPYRDCAAGQAGATVWAPRPPGHGAPEGRAPAGIDRFFGYGDALPGGLVVCQLPEDAAPDVEVALLWL